MVDYEYDEMHYDSIDALYGISIEEERSIWKNCYINKFIYIPSNCPNCDVGKVHLVNFESVLNPLKGGCNKANCKYRFFLRKYSISEKFPRISIQILMAILKGMIIDKKMERKSGKLLNSNIIM